MPTLIGVCPGGYGCVKESGSCGRDLWLWTPEEIRVIETDRLRHEETRYHANREQYIATRGVEAFNAMDQYPIMLRLGYSRISALSIASDYNVWLL